MVIFQYNLYIFIWIKHSCLTNTVYAMDPNNSVIKRLWCILVTFFLTIPPPTKGFDICKANCPLFSYPLNLLRENLLANIKFYSVILYFKDLNFILPRKMQI